MKHKTFMAFIWPSLLAMILFIALPILSVGYQSLFIEHEQVLKEAKNCGPFGCTTAVSRLAAAVTLNPQQRARNATRGVRGTMVRERRDR